MLDIVWSSVSKSRGGPCNIEAGGLLALQMTTLALRFLWPERLPKSQNRARRG